MGAKQMDLLVVPAVQKERLTSREKHISQPRPDSSIPDLDSARLAIEHNLDTPKSVELNSDFLETSKNSKMCAHLKDDESLSELHKSQDHVPIHES